MNSSLLICQPMLFGGPPLRCAIIPSSRRPGNGFRVRGSGDVDAGRVEAPLVVSMAKAAASDLARRVAGTGIQLQGGIGMTWELQLYFKRARASEVAFGSAAWHRQRVARLINP
jgi:alkylation response protein AidB-like acyl-CoA dehydrogenase